MLARSFVTAVLLSVALSAACASTPDPTPTPRATAPAPAKTRAKTAERAATPPPAKTETKATVVALLTDTAVRFDYDSVELSDDGRRILDDVARALADHRAATLVIEGHCDERGTDEYNLALGQKRADVIREYLAQHGVSRDRLKSLSFGKHRPLDDGHGEDAWAKNRRGEIVVDAAGRDRHSG